MGPEGYGHAASVYRGNNDNMDALMALKRETSGVRVSPHMFPTRPRTKRISLSGSG